MLERTKSVILSSLVTLMLTAEAVLAQRPGQTGQGGFTMDKAINWVQSRPGVWVAAGLVVVGIIATVIWRRKGSR